MSYEERIEPTDFDNKTGDVVHLEGGLDSATTVKEAIAAENADINMGVWEAVRTHKAAVFWSLMVSMCVVSQRHVGNIVAHPVVGNGILRLVPSWKPPCHAGYVICCDTRNLTYLEAFRQNFGRYVDEASGYQLTPSWQTAVQQASTVGAFVGILICGQIVEPLGYRRTILIGLVMMIGAVFITFFSETLPVLLVGEFCCGVPWGFFM
jgi:SP family general alpha glucoside:H+ symporter-like MFS transporter